MSIRPLGDELQAAYLEQTGRVSLEEFLAGEVFGGLPVYGGSARAGRAAGFNDFLTQYRRETRRGAGRPDCPPMQQELLSKHYLRKHGPGACLRPG